MIITIVEVNPINEYPPVISLLRILLKQGHKINLISRNINLLPKEFLNNNVNYYEIEYTRKASRFARLKERAHAIVDIKNQTDRFMEKSDILWTTSANTIKVLGRQVLKYKNVLQLMELVDRLSYVNGFVEVPLGEIARKSWKVVVPEMNRAFIEKTWWDLKRMPYVLPNKPFDLNSGTITDDIKSKIEIMKGDCNKKIVYLGGIWADRDLRIFAKAIQNSDRYSFYVIGNPYGAGKNHLKELINNYHVQYLGGFTPPQHLAFLQYADIGLLPYKPVKAKDISDLNALYCAPNKIYEYAGFGIPMIGSFVPGLIIPFEKYNIGCCCEHETIEEVLECIEHIESNYEVMSNNCRKFFDLTDNEGTVQRILYEQ